MFEKLRTFGSRLTKLLTSNSMNLPLGKQFLKYGGEKMTPDWAEVFITDKDHYTGYSFAAINNRAAVVASTAKDNIHTQARTKTFEHPYLTLIKDSSNFSEFGFWYYLSTFLDLEGVAYVMAVRNQTNGGKRTSDIKYFKLLNPYEVTRVLKKDTMEVEGYIERRNGLERTIPPYMIIEIRELNPFSSDDPFARSDAAKESQFTLKTAGDYTRSSLKNNINAPGILSTGVLLGDEQFKNFQSRVRGHKKGEPLFGNGDGVITWTDMQVDLSKAGLKDIQEGQREMQFAVYGMSKTTMGIEQSGTTRETAKVQKGLLMEMHAIPRIQLVNDALNLDFKKNYPEEYEQSKAIITVDNPNTQDQEAEKADVEVKQGQFDLYDDLIAQGYAPKVAAKYVKGEIDITGLGEPTEEPRPLPTSVSLPVPPTKKPKKKESSLTHDHSNDPMPQRDKNQMALIQSQQAVLENAVINIDGQLVSKAIDRIPVLFANALDSESDLLKVIEKKRVENELRVVLDKFYNVIFSLEGEAHIKAREKELELAGDFAMDANIKKIIDSLAEKVSKSHIDTVSNDIYQTARELALQEKSQQEIISAIKSQYTNLISTTRARTISRTETQRAFRFSQLEADKQLANQNDFIERAYKQWRTRSDNPCPICIQLASEPPVPLNSTFRDIGDEVRYSEDGNRKAYKINFTDLEAGSAHPNCWCDYDLVIRKEKRES